MRACLQMNLRSIDYIAGGRAPSLGKVEIDMAADRIWQAEVESRSPHMYIDLRFRSGEIRFAFLGWFSLDFGLTCFAWSIGSITWPTILPVVSNVCQVCEPLVRSRSLKS